MATFGSEWYCANMFSDELFEEFRADRKRLPELAFKKKNKKVLCRTCGTFLVKKCTQVNIIDGERVERVVRVCEVCEGYATKNRYSELLLDATDDDEPDEIEFFGWPTWATDHEQTMAKFGKSFKRRVKKRKPVFLVGRCKKPTTLEGREYLESLATSYMRSFRYESENCTFSPDMTKWALYSVHLLDKESKFKRHLGHVAVNPSEADATESDWCWFALALGQFEAQAYDLPKLWSDERLESIYEEGLNICKGRDVVDGRVYERVIQEQKRKRKFRSKGSLGRLYRRQTTALRDMRKAKKSPLKSLKRWMKDLGRAVASWNRSKDPNVQMNFGLPINVSVDTNKMMSGLMEYIQPVIQQISEKLETVKKGIEWSKILLNAAFSLAHMYQANFSKSSIITSMAQFVISLPLTALVSCGLKRLLDKLFYDDAFIQGVRPKKKPWRLSDQEAPHLLPPARGKPENGKDSNEYSRIDAEEVYRSRSNLFVMVMAGIATCIAAVGIGTLPGGVKTTTFLSRISRIGACITSVALLKDTFVKIVDECLDYIQVSWFGMSTRGLNEWRDFDAWAEQVSSLRTTSFESEATLNPAVKIVVEELLAGQERWSKKFATLKIPPMQHARFVACSLFLERARQKIAMSGVGYQTSRAPATIFHFIGTTGVGKSSMLDMLNAKLLVARGFRDPESLARRVYYRMSTDERWDGYNNLIKGVVFDDFGMVRDTENRPSKEPTELVRAENTTPWQLEMAALEQKANTFFMAEWILLTSNAPWFKWVSLTNPEAVDRRISRKFVQTVVPEYQTTKDGVDTPVLDFVKLTRAAANDPTVFERAWRFQEVGIKAGTDGETIPIGEPLDFIQMYQSLEENLKERSLCADAKLRHARSYFTQAAANIQMEVERERQPELIRNMQRVAEHQPEAIEAATDAQEFADAAMQYQRSAVVVASSEEEMRAKNESVYKYLFGNGRDPNPLKKEDFLRLEGAKRVVRKENLMWHWKDVSPEGKEKFLAPLREPETWTEWATGKVHLNLAKVVMENLVNIKVPDELEEVPEGFDATPLLNKTCAIVRKDEALDFITAVTCATGVYSSLSKKTGEVAVNPRYTAAEMFNSVMYTLLANKNLEWTCCSLHSTQESLTLFTAMQRTEWNTIEWVDWSKMMGNTVMWEAIFITLRVAIMLIAMAVIPYLAYKLFGVGSEEYKKEKKKGKKNTEANTKPCAADDAEDEMFHPGCSHWESREEQTKGNKKSNLESHQDRTRGNAVSNQEGSFDQNATELEVKMKANLYRMKLETDTMVTNLGSAFVVKGRLAITNRHILEVCKAYEDATITFSNPYASFDMSTKNIKPAYPKKEAYGYKDVGMFELPRTAKIHRDMTKYFMTAEDFARHRSVKTVCLYGMSADSNFECRYSQHCLADDREFELTDDKHVTKRVREFYFYAIATKRGDCGSMLMAHDIGFERKIIGMHMAGVTAAGFYTAAGVAIHKGVIADMLDTVDVGNVESDMDGTPHLPDAVGYTQNKEFEGEYEPIGHGEKITGSIKSTIVPSVVADELTEAFGPALTAPAVLCRTRGIDPTVEARKKAFSKNVDPKVGLLAECTYSYGTKVVQNVLQSDARVLTFEEAVQGVDGDAYLTGVKRNTSAGYGWKGAKSNYLGTEERYTLDHPHLVRAYNEMFERVKRGKRSGTIWIDTLKDERRTHAKVEACKTRLFSAGEMSYLIIFRQYFAGFAAHMARNKVAVESCVGINPYSQDWNMLGMALISKGSHVVAGDFTNYDGTLSASILWSCCELIERFYQEGSTWRPIDAVIRRALWMDIVNSVHATGDFLYMWNHGQPSGCPITATLNSIYHSIAARYVFIRCAQEEQPDKASLAVFNKCVLHVNYGDDDVYNISPEIIGWYNQITMTKYFQEIGMTYTDEAKTGELVPYRKLEDVAFLKRKFRWDERQCRFRAPLSLDTITEMARWVKGPKNHWELTAQTLSEALMELAEHDGCTFVHTRKKFGPAIRKLQSKGHDVYDNTYMGFQREAYMRYCM